MITKLNPYPEYKDSHIPWLGNIPENWRLLPGKACFAEKKESNKGMAEKIVLSLSYGRIIVKPEEKLHGLVPESFETYQIINPGDIVFRPTDLQNDINSLRFGISKNRGIITSAYMCLQAKKNLDDRFGYFLLHAYDLKKIFYGLGSGLRQNIDWRDFKYLPCLVPPLEEQQAIVRYLDYMDRRIKRYIRAKQKLIQLLNEQKQAIIHQAVTRGLDPNVPLKPSGVDWLGDIPAHWEVRRFKSVANIRYGVGQPPKEIENGLPLIRATNISFGKITEKDMVFVDPIDIPISRNPYLKENEIIVVRSGAYTADSAIIPKKYEGSIAGYDMVATITGANPEFIAITLLSTYLRDDQLITFSMRSAQPHLNANELGSSIIFLPPLQEQIEIVKSASKKIESLDEVKLKTISEITLLKEYHTRLIADVVTGKVDVSQAAASLPEEAQETIDWEDLEDAEAEEDQPPEMDEP